MERELQAADLPTRGTGTAELASRAGMVTVIIEVTGPTAKGQRIWSRWRGDLAG